MLELLTSYSFSQIPYITYEALDDYGQRIVQDFSPETAHTPAIMDVDGFVEYYLHLNVEFRRISYNRKILGMTAFNGGLIEVINEDTGRPEQLSVAAGTVVIDTSLMTKRNTPRLRFTMIHEAAHWLLHRKAYAEDNPFGPAGVYENQFLAAKEGRMDYSRSLKEHTDIERMERQADFLASAILMPISAMRLAYRNYFSYFGERPHQIVRGKNPMDDCHVAGLPEYIAKEFGVSKRAALIRLEKLNAIVDSGYMFYRR